MMVLFILCGIVSLAAAVDDSDPTKYAMNGVDGLLYEIPEYEDPQLTLLRLSDMGAMPVVTILETDKNKKGISVKKETLYYEQRNEGKKSLDDILTRLHETPSDLRKENIHDSGNINQHGNQWRKVLIKKSTRKSN